MYPPLYSAFGGLQISDLFLDQRLHTVESHQNRIAVDSDAPGLASALRITANEAPGPAVRRQLRGDGVIWYPGGEVEIVSRRGQSRDGPGRDSEGDEETQDEDGEDESIEDSRKTLLLTIYIVVGCGLVTLIVLCVVRKVS